MRVWTLEVGPLAANCHIIAPDGAADGTGPIPAGAGAALSGAAGCVVIDPGAEAERIGAEVRRRGLTLEMILLTHAHADHIGGAEGLLSDWPAAVLACSAETARRAASAELNLSRYIGEEIVAPPAGKILEDGEKFTAAGTAWRAVAVPGHEPGEMVYITGDSGGMAFTGDTVFAGSIGRSDFPGGDGHLLVRGLLRLLSSLPGDCRLFPGHGPATTAGEELAGNPFLRG